jgi:hypothetical protein
VEWQRAKDVTHDVALGDAFDIMSGQVSRNARNSGLIGIPLGPPLPTIWYPRSGDSDDRVIASPRYCIMGDRPSDGTGCSGGIAGMLNGFGREADGIEIGLAGMGNGMSRIESVRESSAHGGP